MAAVNYSKYISLQDHLREHLTYDSTTGVVAWRDGIVKKTGAHIPGKPLGCKTKDGYLQANIKCKSIYVHSIAWFLHYGEWPTKIIDHKNGIKSDNRIENLRDVSYAENAENRRRANTRSRLGIMGVSPAENGRFTSQIRTNGKGKGLGTFDTPEQAHQAYLSAKRALHPGCTI